jgi:tripartite-type tricarboxylate transporter receptor subunit TctC
MTFLRCDSARLLLRLVAAGVSMASTLLPAQASSYPVKPIELIVQFPAGSSADVVARVLANGLTKHVGQNVIVINRPGAGGALAYKYVQAAKPDGYTLVFNSNSISTVHHSGLTTFDYRAFDPIARVTVENPVIAVRKDSPWNNLSDMMAHARSKPGEIRLGNSGTGSHTHISAEAFVAAQKVEVLHVPFAAAQIVTSLLGGHIDALVQLPGALSPHVRAGTLKVIGTLSSAREPAFPIVPTALEQGMGFQADMWRGVAAPKGTPREVLAKLEAALQKAVNSSDFKAQGEKSGFIPAFQPAREFAQTIATDDATLAQLMLSLGLKLR